MDFRPPSKSNTNTHNTDRNFRLFGLILIAIGAALLWFFMYRPIDLAQSGVEDITVHKKLALLGLTLSGFGSFFLIFGKKSIEILPEGDTDLKKISWKYWVTIIVLFAISSYAWSLFEGALENLGYKMD